MALYITKAPVPFINKVPQRTAEQDSAEAERNKQLGPERAAGRQAPAGARRAGAPSAAPAAGVAPAPRRPRRQPAAPRAGTPARDPAAIRRRRRSHRAGRRSVRLLRAGRRLHPRRGRRAAARAGWRCWA
ncbi:MAG: hypothetical protein MZW92_04500 [Comamonadaceae bacterium]|nr:hypothetical protein [Comamonadaceae bacterium]